MKNNSLNKALNEIQKQIDKLKSRLVEVKQIEEEINSLLEAQFQIKKLLKINEDKQDLQPNGTQIGYSLPEVFTLKELEEKLGKKPYIIIAYWKRQNWIEMVEFGKYRKLQDFGK